MSAAVAESVTHSRSEESIRSRIPERIRIFADYCLLNESAKSYFRLLFPVVSVALLIAFERFSFATMNSTTGSAVFRRLIFPIAFFIALNAAQHISNAISWEISLEMRDLVRMTGINPVVLLWCRSLSRVWTTILSAVLFLPILAYVRTLGGVTSDLFLAAGSWLLLILCLTTGFAMMAGVSVSKGATSDATAASATFLLALIYHLLFWCPAAIILMSGWVLNSMNTLPGSSFSWRLATQILGYSPLVRFYRNLSDPLGFSFDAPEFWVHFLTAAVCVLLAVRVARNRFRVTSQGDTDNAPIQLKVKTNSVRPTSIPRCTDRPYLWKDQYILGATDKGGAWFWFGFSLLVLHGVFTAVFYQLTYVSTVMTMILISFMTAARFDALLAVEFREKTFDSLIILPVNPWTIILSKVQVAAWGRRWLLVPLLVTSFLSACYSPSAVCIGLAFTLLATVFLFEISIVNNMAQRKRLIGLVIAVLFVGMLVADIVAFQRLTNAGGIAVSAGLLIAGSAICHAYNHARLKNWSPV